MGPDEDRDAVRDVAQATDLGVDLGVDLGAAMDRDADRARGAGLDKDMADKDPHRNERSPGIDTRPFRTRFDIHRPRPVQWVL